MVSHILGDGVGRWVARRSGVYAKLHFLVFVVGAIYLDATHLESVWRYFKFLFKELNGLESYFPITLYYHNTCSHTGTKVRDLEKFHVRFISIRQEGCSGSSTNRLLISLQN